MWNRSLVRTKLKAMAVHMSLSAAIFLPLAYLIVFRWYPGPFFLTDGGWQGVRIMLFVDVVLGPLLTFMIFNPAKSRLALGVDFSFISVTQVIALLYGIHTVESTRIWAVVFNTDGLYGRSFVAVSKDRYVQQDLPADAWGRFGEGPQYWVYLRDPKGAELERAIKLGEQGMPLEALHYLYDPMQPHLDEIKSKALDMTKLTAADPQLGGEYRDFLQRHADSPGGLHFYRLIGFYRSALIALDGEGRYVGYLNHDLPKTPPPSPK